MNNLGDLIGSLKLIGLKHKPKNICTDKSFRTWEANDMEGLIPMKWKDGKGQRPITLYYIGDSSGTVPKKL
jgi:hypothetical protein